MRDFWNAIRTEKIAKKDFDFSGYIFPEFEAFNLQDTKEGDTAFGQLRVTKTTWNFFPADSPLIFPETTLFKGVIFEGRSEFVSIAFRGLTDFSSAVFRDTARFNGSLFDRGQFVRTTFEKDCDFANTVFQIGASFNFASFVKRCHLENVTFSNAKGDTTFLGTAFNSIVSFNGTTFQNETYFSDTIFNDRAVFYSAKGDTIVFNFIKLGTQSLLDFGSLTLKTFQMTSVQNFSAVIRITDTVIGEQLVLKNTALGKSELSNVNLSGCINISITATTFTETMFNGVLWGIITEERFSASRDVYRQLKHVLEEQGNFIEANRFYSLEMKEYKRELSQQSLGFDTWQDKVVFFLHEKVSNYSQSWFLPLLWFFNIGILLTIYGKLHSHELHFFKGWELLAPVVLFFFWTVGKGVSELSERFKTYQFDIVLPSLVVIFAFLIGVPNSLNEFCRVINPFGIIRDNDTYKGIEFGWFIHKSLMAFIVYQFVVTLRMQTRRK